jgi:hypothetical protein
MTIFGFYRLKNTIGDNIINDFKFLNKNPK